ncbi:MAG: hypothetical protein V1758_17530, partial [Pseudomonadota bacterium]
MEKTVTATEATRDFSELLNRIKFSGESFIIKRGGKPVASIGPVREKKAVRPLKELKEILNALPRMGDDLEAFEKDLVAIQEAQPSLPEGIYGDNPTSKGRKMTEEEMDNLVVAQAGNDSAWEAPVQVRRGEPGTISIPADLAARAAFLAQVHRASGVEEWLTRVIRERIELEEGAFAEAKRDLT